MPRWIQLHYDGSVAVLRGLLPVLRI